MPQRPGADLRSPPAAELLTRPEQPVLQTSENFLLSRLPESALSALTPVLAETDLRQGAVLQEGGRPIEHVYFPLSGMVSLVAVTLAGESIETGIVGREGVVSGFLAAGGMPSFAQAIVQIEGRALRAPASAFRSLCDTHLALRTEVDRYQAFVLLQAQQNVACHALHSLEGRLCRWLLQSQELIESDRIALTQEFLSYMLGVRRPTVSVAAAELQKDGLIQYHRGTITVVDRDGLLRRSCQCFEVLHECIKSHRV
jgi:CRP-like cAMP-binding protein